MAIQRLTNLLRANVDGAHPKPGFLRKATAVVGVLTLTAATLTACGSGDEASKSAETTSTAAASSAAGATESARSTERVVVLNTGQLENMLELGIVPVGTALAKGSKGIPEFVKEAYGKDNDLDSIVTLGTRDNPDIEAIAALKPTLICANQRTDEAILNQLRQIAPLALGKGGGENWQADFLTIAEAVNKKDEAQAKLDLFEEEAKAARASWPNPTPTVNFLRTKGDAFEIFGAKSFAGTIAAAAGLARPESGQFEDKSGHPVSAEQLATANADYLFYAVANGGSDPSTTPVWQTMPVVEAGHAIKVDYEAWYTNASYFAAMNLLKGMKDAINS